MIAQLTDNALRSRLTGRGQKLYVLRRVHALEQRQLDTLCIVHIIETGSVHCALDNLQSRRRLDGRDQLPQVHFCCVVLRVIVNANDNHVSLRTLWTVAINMVNNCAAKMLLSVF